MTELYRCDICGALITPDDGDERAEMEVRYWIDESGGGNASIDLCESCRPESADAHMAWMKDRMAKEGGG